MTEVELWKFIPGYENYMISNLGRVKHVRTGKLKVYSLHTHGKKSYKRLRVSLSIEENKKKHFCVHKLVAENFLSNPKKYTHLLFLDENYENCKSSNLKYVSEAKHKEYWKEREEKEYRYYGNEAKPVKAIHTITGNEIVFDSLKEASRFLKTRPDYINKVLRGIQKTHRKYQFQLITN
jgi:hypothetical protein